MLGLRRTPLLAAAISAYAIAFASACTGDPKAAPAPTEYEDAGTVTPEETPDPGDPDGGTKPGSDGGGGNKDGGGSTPTGELLGTLSGSCGIVKTLLTASSTSFEQNLLTFVAAEKYEKAGLSSGGQKMYDTPNAGGSSAESEVMSFEVLRYCEGANLVKTETEVKYAPANGGPASITDILVEIGGKKVGVSVTRAYKPPSQALTDAEVKNILEKKFEGINVSSQRVLPQDKWVKQVLHVFTANKAATDAVVRVLPSISSTLKADTVVLLTQTAGGGFIYCNNPDPPLGSECQ